MRVSFETYTLDYKGQNEEHNLPIFERKDIKRVEGDVVDTVVLNWPDALGNLYPEPCFVVALDDLSFTYIAIRECRKIENIYLDD